MYFSSHPCQGIHRDIEFSVRPQRGMHTADLTFPSVSVVCSTCIPWLGKDPTIFITGTPVWRTPEPLRIWRSGGQFEPTRQTRGATELDKRLWIDIQNVGSGNNDLWERHSSCASVRNSRGSKGVPVCLKQ